MLTQGRDGLGDVAYARRLSEQTLLYQLVEAHFPGLINQLAQQGKSLPEHVHREFEAYLKCGRLEHGFLRVCCDKCRFERLVAFSCKKRGFCPSCGARRMAETAALLGDEVFPDVPLRQWVISFPFPLRYLFAAHPQAMGRVLGFVYRAISTNLIHRAGYSLKEGATGAVSLRGPLNPALRISPQPEYTLSHPYIARPGVAVPRLSLSSSGKVLYTLKTPYRDGTTQVAFDPVDFIARLVALVPKPRVNLTRYHGVLAPNHHWRGWVTPAKRGKGVKPIANPEVHLPTERHAARACPALSGMTWAQRLKRVFNIDIEVCTHCGVSVRVIACIEDQDTIDRILAHLRRKEQNIPSHPLLAPPTRAPPDK